MFPLVKIEAYMLSLSNDEKLTNYRTHLTRRHPEFSIQILQEQSSVP